MLSDPSHMLCTLATSSNSVFLGPYIYKLCIPEEETEAQGPHKSASGGQEIRNQNWPVLVQELRILETSLPQVSQDDDHVCVLSEYPGLGPKAAGSRPWLKDLQQ